MRITNSGVYIVSPRYKEGHYPSNLTEYYREFPDSRDVQRLALLQVPDYLQRGRAFAKNQWRVATHLVELTHPLKTAELAGGWVDDPPRARPNQAFYVLYGETKRLLDILVQRERKRLLETPGLKWFLANVPKLKPELSAYTAPHLVRAATERIIDEKLAHLSRSPHAVSRPDGFFQYARQLQAEQEAHVRERLVDDFYVAKLSAAERRAKRPADREDTLRRVQLFRGIADKGLKRYAEDAKLPSFIRTYMLRNRLGRIVVDLEKGKLLDVVPPARKT